MTTTIEFSIPTSDVINANGREHHIVLAITSPASRTRDQKNRHYHREEMRIPGLAVCGRQCTTRVLLDVDDTIKPLLALLG